MEVHMQTPHQENIVLHVTDSYESTAILLSSWLYVHGLWSGDMCWQHQTADMSRLLV